MSVVVGHPVIYEINPKSSSLRVEPPCGRPMPIEWLRWVRAPAVTAVVAAPVAGCVELALHHRHGVTAEATPPEEALQP
jgi:hypothetical protein